MLRQTLDFLRVGLLPSNGDPRPLYALLGPENLPGERSRYINLGYWADAGLDSFDAGAGALADLLAREAKLAPGQVVLDVGFGYGDQLVRWLETAPPRRLVGLNLSEGQVRHARKLVDAHPLGRRVELVLGSACAVPVSSGSVDRVVALESAFHFSPRTDFFAEAFRTLSPGGLLATADIVLMPGHRVGWPFTTAWRIPEANLHDREDYARKLEACGFVDVRVESIRQHVFEPLLDRLAVRLRQPDLVGRMNPLLRVACTPGAYARRVLGRFDYVIATARKP
jgi:cyclopropane fatty-acyl-phospholipid synthase-like methyltransferase